MDQENRIVVLIDMDCFYCQVEEKLNPELKGKPIAVVQYNPWKGGGIIAVNYVARAMGVTRHMRGDEAKEKCPEIQLPSVQCLRGKADITKYRDAGKAVAKVLQRFTPLLERASIDEAYLDITTPVQQRLKTLNVNTITIDILSNTFALGYDSIDEFVADVQNVGSDNIDFEYEHAKQLLVGAVIVSEIRAAVYNETGYQCSAGIAHNKILAKLVCGMNKPNKQTLLPKHCINILYQSLSIKKVKHLGGKFGDSVCETLKINKMGELQKFTERDLQTKFDEKNGTWLYNIARGIDLEPVQAKFNPKSIGCCKQFRGKTALVDLESLRKWLKDLGDEIEERLENDALENNRTPRQMVVSFSTQQPNGRDVSSSRSYNFTAEDDLCGELFSKKALEMLLDSAEGVKLKEGEENRHLKAPIKFLGISVGKFEEYSENKKTRKINYYFSGASCSKDVSSEKVITNNVINNDKTVDKNEGKTHVFRKFFQNNNIPDNLQTNELNEKEETRQNGENMLESSLDKQESFFAKFLKTEFNKNTLDNHSKPVKIKEENRPTTPDCNIVNIGEASNDTEYSGSTIDMEINKSISLFEDDPVDIDRVGNMRQLLNKSKLLEEAFDETEQEELQFECKSVNVQENEQVQISETFKCPECGKTVSVNMFDTHSDYHFALKLREEERVIKRKEVVDKIKDKEMNRNQETKATKMRQEDAVVKNDGVSIANYFTKIDGSVPTETCSECGKRVPLEKFAEHLDFHEAQKLSRELNNRSSNSVIQGNSVKRKRKLISPAKKPKVPCKSIDLFFR